MTAYTPTTIEQKVTALGYSPLTSSMLLDLILDTVNDKMDWNADTLGITSWDVLDGIKAVIDNKPQDFGDEFAARVWEALSYTPDPFAPY